MIRLATMTDTRRMADLMVEAGAKSRYRDICGVDHTYAKGLLREIVFNNENRSPAGTWVNVVEQDGQIQGYHIGMQQRIGLVGERFEAVDAQFYVTPDAPAKAYLQLLNSFYEWAERTPRIAVIRPGATDMLEDPERIAKVYERHGFRRSGLIFEREIVRERKEAA